MTINLASWEARIHRARELAAQATATKELLTFYTKVLETQKQVYDSLRGLREWLPSSSLSEDLHVLREYARSFLQSVSSVSPTALAEQAPVEEGVLGQQAFSGRN